MRMVRMMWMMWMVAMRSVAVRPVAMVRAIAGVCKGTPFFSAGRVSVA